MSRILKHLGMGTDEEVKDLIDRKEDYYLSYPIKKANKLMGYNGRILVRKSGTEPKIRIMAESHDRSLILKCIKIIKRSIK